MKRIVSAAGGSFRSSRLVLLALAGVILANLLGSWYWVRTNQVMLGHDSAGYLETTVVFAQRLATPSIRTFFQLFIYDDYRPPLLFFAVQPFYRLFGISMDSAQIVNVLTLGAVVLLTYGLGKSIGGRQVGLVAALLVGLFPLMAAMARLFYTEILLTAMVALNLLALVRGEGFTRRGWSLAWGASLGAGLLVKWTMPLYVALPLFVYLWDKRTLLAQGIPFDRRHALLAPATGLAASLVWFWPGRHDVQGLLLGNGLLVGWLAVLSLLLYCWWAAPTSAANLWTALLLGIAIASLWYLPHADFAFRLLLEDAARGQEGANPFSLENYTRNLGYFYRQHLGALAFWSIWPLLLLTWVWRLVRRQAWPANAALLWWSLGSALLALGVIAQSNARNLAPLLPAIAVLMALTLRFYRRRVGLLIGVAWFAILATQWAIFTFDAFAGFYLRTERLWVMENYAAPPASNLTSLQYAIYDDVLQTITAGQREQQRLGMLIHMDQLHRGVFRFQTNAKQLNAEIVPLTSEQSLGWFDTLSAQWVLVKDGDNHDISPPAQDVVQRIFAGDPLFHTLYQEIKRYPLPHGETAYLYHRAKGPGRPLDLPLQVEQTAVVAEAIRQAWSPQAQLVYAHSGLAVWVGMHDPARQRIVVLDAQAGTPAARRQQLNGTLLVVWDHEAQELHDWLDQHAYRAYEVGNDFAAMAIYGRPGVVLEPVAGEATAWPSFRLSEVHSFSQIEPGQVLPITYTLQGDASQELKISFRLLTAQGEQVASHDRPLQPADRLGLFVPPNAQPGRYTVAAVAYDPQTMALVPDRRGAESTTLFAVDVAQSSGN